ncbi:MAG: hypothetical protein RR232_01040 [Clostridia bacterium]
MTIKAKRILSVVCVLVVSFAFAAVAFAAEGDAATSTQAMTTAFTTIKSDLMSAVGVIAPIAIGIFGVFLLWKYGKKIFKTIAN